MEHANEYCHSDSHTLVVTSGGGNSYIYHCPVCGNNRRFSEPKHPEQVFCNGLDMGTIDPNAPVYVEFEPVEE